METGCTAGWSYLQLSAGLFTRSANIPFEVAPTSRLKPALAMGAVDDVAPDNLQVDAVFADELVSEGLGQWLWLHPAHCIVVLALVTDNADLATVPTGTMLASTFRVTRDKTNRYQDLENLLRSDCSGFDVRHGRKS